MPGSVVHAYTFRVQLRHESKRRISSPPKFFFVISETEQVNFFVNLKLILVSENRTVCETFMLFRGELAHYYKQSVDIITLYINIIYCIN